MKRKITYLFLAIAAIVLFLSLAFVADAQVKVTVDYNANGTPEFKFKTVPTPAKDDAGSKAKFVLVVGELDPNGAGFSALTDGLLPSHEDEPAANLFFNAGGTGGRFRMDLGSVIEIKQINSYSWHSGNGAPQVYALYASDGADPKFCAEPKGDVDPASCGWTLVTSVDTRRGRGGGGGGQYGASINDARGSLGKYRYLLFDCSATETDDDAGNTFFSEIDVLAKKSP